MKSKLIIIVAATLLLCTQAQAGKTYKVDNGKVVSVLAKTDTVSKKKDKVFQVVDGITFYQGSKGGIYYYRTSKKTGKPYKYYVKQ